MVEKCGHLSSKGSIGGGRLGRDLESKEVNISVRGDSIGYFDGDEPKWLDSIESSSSGGGTKLLQNTLDKMNTLVCEIRDLNVPATTHLGLKTKNKSVDSEVARRRATAINSVQSELRNINTRSRAMVSCYKGENKAFYSMHCDNAIRNGRKLTAILYLNENWIDKDGGLLVIHPRSALFADSSNVAAAAGSGSAQSKVCSIVPSLGRMVMFWSDLRCPHEVTPVVSSDPERNRFAITLWFIDSVEKDDAIATNTATTANSNTDITAITTENYSTHAKLASTQLVEPQTDSVKPQTDSVEPQTDSVEPQTDSVDSLSSPSDQPSAQPSMQPSSIATLSKISKHADNDSGSGSGSSCRLDTNVAVSNARLDFDDEGGGGGGGSMRRMGETAMMTADPPPLAMMTADPPPLAMMTADPPPPVSLDCDPWIGEHEHLSWIIEEDSARQCILVNVMFKSSDIWDNRSQLALDVNETLIKASISSSLLPNKFNKEISLVLLHITNKKDWVFDASRVIAKFKKKRSLKQMNISITNNYVGI